MYSDSSDSELEVVASTSSRTAKRKNETVGIDEKDKRQHGEKRSGGRSGVYTSEMWIHYKRKYHGGVHVSSVCRYCAQEYRASGGLGNLKKHITKKHFEKTVSSTSSRSSGEQTTLDSNVTVQKKVSYQLFIF